MCADPTEDATAPLAVRLADETVAEAAQEVIAEYGTVEATTRFGSIHATVPEPAVAPLLEALPAAVEAVETRTRVADETGAEE